MAMANLRVGARLGLGFGAVIAMMAVITFLGFSNIRGVQGELDNVVNKEFTKTALANDMLEGVNAIGIFMRDSLFVTGQANIQIELDGIIKMRKAVKENLDRLQAVMTSDADKVALAKVVDARIKYVAAQEAFIKLVEAGKQEAAKDYLMQEAMALQDSYIDVLNELVAYQTGAMKKIGDEANKKVETALALIIVIALIALAAAAVTGFLITRSITRPLQQAVDLAGAVASGDLTQSIEVKSTDEVGQLLQALKAMNGSLTSIVTEVRDSTEAITTASQEIALGNTDLSARTEEQASSLEETASSMEELTSTVRQNADNAKQANQLANNASDIAVKGGKVVDDVVHTMASISDSSKKIVDIISVIEGIAFQTNILALNAAVEAARAGEQGRGFAVVAGEVRNLAQRSAEAAKEIKALIGDSVSKVDAGSKQVDQAGATMAEIVQAVKRVTDIMSEISAASSEQSEGIEQVNQAIIQMDETTQQNAAQVEEAAAAAETMQGQAETLLQAVSIFKLERGQGRAQKVVATARAASIPAIAQRHTRTAVVTRKQRNQAQESSDGDWKEF